MNMEKDNVFLHDVDVPEVVREKMDAAFLTIQKESGKTMQKEKKETRKMTGMLVSAACMVTVVMAVGAVMKGSWKHAAIEEETFPQISGVDDNADNTMTAVENTFTLKIMAAELEKDKPVQLVSDDSLITEKQAGEWMMESIEGGGVAYCINVPFTCQGNYIKSITYSINNGAFQVVQPEGGGSIIMDGELYGGELNTGIIGGYDTESEAGEEASCSFELIHYRSFTVDYQRQSDADTWINICNSRADDGELESLIFGDTSLDDKNTGIQRMLDNTIITCIVHYTDGTDKAVDIHVNSCIMTRAEAGMKIKDDPNRKEIFITFELK